MSHNRTSEDGTGAAQLGNGAVRGRGRGADAISVGSAEIPGGGGDFGVMWGGGDVAAAQPAWNAT